MTTHNFTPDLRSLALRAMTDAGLATDFSAAALTEAEAVSQSGVERNTSGSLREMRSLLWSSIDNSESRDLDQVEYVEALPDGRLRLLIGIADVDAFVPKGGAIDRQAYLNTVSVYTPAVIFPMLPEQLSTGMTSLLEGEARLALVIELVLTSEGVVSSKNVYRAVVQNHAKLSYEEVGAWLENQSPVPASVAQVPGLEEQLRLQAETTKLLHALRKQHGALELETVEAEPVIEGGEVVRLDIKRHTLARDIIENFMIAANTSMAEFLQERGVPSLRRVVRTPERWNLLVRMAKGYNVALPEKPDSRALSDFLAARKQKAPAKYAELSLAVLKMMGAGEYMVEAPGLDQQGHFGLAVNDYTHSTAPNRRYPDLVTQRCLKAATSGAEFPYSKDELEEIAARCNRMEAAARKVERTTQKAAIAVLLSKHTGETYDAIVTGVKERGTFVRLVALPADGRVVEGEQGLSVGERVRVRLLSTDPERGYIDFANLPQRTART